MVILDFGPFEKYTIFGFDLFNEKNPVIFKGHTGQVNSVLFNHGETKVLTAHVPLPLAQKIDNLAAQLDRPRAWIVIAPAR
jgi:hypothetical protein